MLNNCGVIVIREMWHCVLCGTVILWMLSSELLNMILSSLHP